MDPVSAVSFAASIFTFADFSWKLVQGTYEVYNSTTGTTIENAHITKVVRDLKSATESISSDFTAKGKHEQALLKLSQECQAAAEELEQVLRKLEAKGSDSRWESLQVKWRSMRKEKQVASLEKRLSEYRMEVLVRLQLMMSDEQSSIKRHFDTIQNDGLKLSLDSAEELKTLRQELHTTCQLLRSRKPTPDDPSAGRGAYTLELNLRNGSSEVTETIEARPSSLAHVDGSAIDVKNLADALRRSISELESKARSLPGETSILQRLYFQSMHNREDNVETAEEGTFEWMLDEKTSLAETVNDKRYKVAQAFLNFLRSENGVYFVCGKAGAGKSTLMKFLGNSDRVRHELEDCWAGTKKLVFIFFYFWNSGDKLQMSLEGFYRTLLFETLRQCPGLTGTIFPLNTHPGSDKFELGAFRLAELTTAVDSLFSETDKFPDHRFCFLIDGLDEYEGETTAHFRLARSIKSWAHSPHVKIICSGRPYVEFLKTFDEPKRTNQLHELTENDISTYIEKRIRKELQESGKASEWDAYRDMSNEMTDMAEGVFLWARLAVQSILSGIAHEDSEASLRQRIRATPRDINKLFQTMMNSIDPTLRDRSKMMFLLAIHNPFEAPMFAVMYSWLGDLDDIDFPFSAPIQGYSREEIARRHRIVRHQLAGLTKGLLELRTCDQADAHAGNYMGLEVQFLHRTVKDFVVSELVPDCAGLMDPRYRLMETYLRLGLAFIKFLPLESELQKMTADLISDSLYDLGNTLGTVAEAVPFRIIDDFGCVISTWNRQLNDTRSSSRIRSDGDERPGCCNPMAIRTYNLFSKNPSMHEYSGPGSFAVSHLCMATHCCQHAYVIHRLRENPHPTNIQNEMGHILYLSSCHPSANPDLVDFLFSMGIRPDTCIRTTHISRGLLHPLDPLISQWRKGDTYHSSVPVWLIFLRDLACELHLAILRSKDSGIPNSQSLADQFKILEQFLVNRADREAKIICYEDFAAAGPGIASLPEDKDKRLDPKGLFCFGIEQFLELLPPSNAHTLRKFTTRSIRGSVRSALGQIKEKKSSKVTSKSRFRTVNTQSLRKMCWCVVGVVSKEHELVGYSRLGLFSEETISEIPLTTRKQVIRP